MPPSFHPYASHGYTELAWLFATQAPQTATSGGTVPACNWLPVISLIFIARGSVLLRERW